MPDHIKCEYCGKIKEEVIFCIGASSKKDWCMIEGTGKMTCPDCYDVAVKEGQDRIDAHVKSYNKRCESI